MFYAPWDVDSVRARDTFESLATVFSGQPGPYFAAVNCWTQGGECYRDFGEGKATKAKIRLNEVVQSQIVPLNYE